MYTSPWIDFYCFYYSAMLIHKHCWFIKMMIYKWKLLLTFPGFRVGFGHLAHVKMFSGCKAYWSQQYYDLYFFNSGAGSWITKWIWAYMWIIFLVQSINILCFWSCFKLKVFKCVRTWHQDTKKKYYCFFQHSAAIIMLFF